MSIEPGGLSKSCYRKIMVVRDQPHETGPSIGGVRAHGKGGTTLPFLQRNRWYICSGLFNIRILELLFLFVIIMAFEYAASQNALSLPETDKRYIVRIDNPENMRGTGFILSDTAAGFFLVTNRHVVASKKTGALFDSVFLHINVIAETGKVKSLDSVQTLYLTYKGVKLYREHLDKRVDLVVISLGVLDTTGNRVTNPVGVESLIGFRTDHVFAKENFQPGRLLDGVQVQILGFSEQMAQADQFHVSRFGHLSYYPSEEIRIKIDERLQSLDWLVIDVSSRGGDSGGPVFYANPSTRIMYLMGFVQAVATQEELCFAIPSYYILEAIQGLKSTFIK